jgi:RNA polymerase sporulation-specific sigma factor
MSAVGIAACLWSMKRLICKGGGKRGRNRRIQIAGDSWKFAFGPPRQASPDDGPPNRGGVSGSPGIRRPAGGRFPLGRDFLSLHPFKKYYTQSSDQEDLISIGTIGLIKGISSFDPAKGARLATYAARCIENEILMYFRSQKKLQGEVSLSDSIDTDKEGNALQLMDIVGVDDTMLEDLHDRDNALRLHKLVREYLTAREAEIVRLRYGLGGTVPLTQREIASSFGISRSYVSRIEKRALEKLREALQDPPAHATGAALR